LQPGDDILNSFSNELNQSVTINIGHCCCCVCLVQFLYSSTIQHNLFSATHYSIEPVITHGAYAAQGKRSCRKTVIVLNMSNCDKKIDCIH